MTTETLTWHPLATEGPPDADMTVLVTLEGDNEPTWVGWWDGEQWCDVCSGAPFSSTVTAWADMPAGYRP